MGCSASIDKNQSLPYKNGPASHCIRMDKTYQKQRANIPELVRADSNRDVILANQVKRDLRQREKSIYLDDQEQDTKGSRNLDEPSINEEYYRCPVSGDDEDEEEAGDSEASIGLDFEDDLEREFESTDLIKASLFSLLSEEDETIPWERPNQEMLIS